MTLPKPVHYIPEAGKYKLDEWGQRVKVQNIPVEVTFPKEADLGLWGGEGYIVGYQKKNNEHMKPRYPVIKRPRLYKKYLYSEILDQWMEITVTKRTLDLIDENYGLDFYILKTHEVDLCSKLGMRLKRQMLTALVDKQLYPENPEKREEIYEKYKEFIIPREEIPWLGLTISEADKQQATAEEQAYQAQIRPLKYVLMEDLVDKLKNNQLDDVVLPEQDSWVKKINPFKSTKA